MRKWPDNDEVRTLLDINNKMCVASVDVSVSVCVSVCGCVSMLCVCLRVSLSPSPSFCPFLSPARHQQQDVRRVCMWLCLAVCLCSGTVCVFVDVYFPLSFPSSPLMVINNLRVRVRLCVSVCMCFFLSLPISLPATHLPPFSPWASPSPAAGMSICPTWRK